MVDQDLVLSLHHLLEHTGTWEFEFLVADERWFKIVEPEELLSAGCVESVALIQSFHSNVRHVLYHRADRVIARIIQHLQSVMMVNRTLIGQKRTTMVLDNIDENYKQ